ncbi:MAG: hypothetical protein CSA70_02060 [Rhodobacterales bacterium]|nr:MAG: hypothetical protein CSA70_02060 [Rhodobacterales bacterium]
MPLSTGTRAATPGHARTARLRGGHIRNVTLRTPLRPPRPRLLLRTRPRNAPCGAGMALTTNTKGASA